MIQNQIRFKIITFIMKVVILAGGLGTRLAEETELKPKPMVEIGGHPILWHIMKILLISVLTNFSSRLVTKAKLSNGIFYDYHSLNGNITINFADGQIDVRERECEDWRVHLIETGQNTMTGGRVKRLEDHLKDETFMVTYGDGVS